MLSRREKEFIKKALAGKKLDDKDYIVRCRLRKKVNRIIEDRAILDKAIAAHII